MKFFFTFLIVLIFSGCAVDENLAFDESSKNDSSVDLEQDDKSLPVSDEVITDSEVEDNEVEDKEAADNTSDSEITDEEEPSDDDQVKLEGVIGLSADSSIDSIDLIWKNPTMEGFEKVVVVLDNDAYAQTPVDGTEVYSGTDETYSETTVEAGKNYFYSVFACYGDLGCSDPSYVSAQPCYSQLDVVFVMDVSTTMRDILADLENEIGLVWDFVEGKFPDETPHFGLSVFVDDYLLTNSGQPFSTVQEIKTEFNNWYTHTSTNEQTQSTASNMDWPENSLDALAVSATDFNWRDSDKTLRIVIHATDDTFLEKPNKFDSDIAVEHTYDETVALLVQEKVRVGAFAAKIGGFSQDVDVEPGFFTDYNSKPSIPQATGGEVYFIEDVKDGTIHMYDSVNTFIENVMCRGYDDK